MLYAQRKQLHQAIAEWYQRNHAEELEPHYPLLAHHWSRAEDTERALHYLPLAAASALAANAAAEAVEFVRAAQDLAGTAAEAPPLLERARWLAMRGRAENALGRLTDARGSFEAALGLLGEAPPASRARLLASIAAETRRQSRNRKRGLPAAPGDAAELERLDLAAGTAERLFLIYVFAGESARALWTVLRATNLAEAMGRPSPLLGRCYTDLAAALTAVPMHEQARHYAERAMALAEQFPEDLSDSAWAHLGTAVCLVGSGQWEEVERRSLVSLERNRALGDLRRWEEASDNLGRMRLLYGRFDDPEDGLYMPLLATARKRDIHQSEGWGLALWGMNMVHRQEFEELGTVARELEHWLEAFSRYAPITALDMVRNIPGFSIDDGGGARGFGGAPPNVLVDSERVSSKSESPSDLLGRIPASQVERIDLIRGQAGGLDLRGQAVVANVIRREGAKTSGAWNVAGRVRPPSDRARPRGSASLSTERGPLKLTLGGELGIFRGIDDAREDVTGPDGARFELRDEADRRDGHFHNVSIQARLRTDRTAWGLNLLADGFEADGGESSRRTPEGASSFELFQGNVREREGLEVGFDVERDLTVDLGAKLIALYRSNAQYNRGSLVLDGVDRSATRSQSLDQERILRMELDYAGLDGHMLEFAVEGALNTLDSDFALARADARGVLVPQPVPGASTTVEEERADVSLSDSLQRGAVSIDAVLAGEFSTLRQSGGFSDERSFAFFKPALTLTLTPRDEVQLRMRALREIGQLDFFDFVSTADLGDDELALGNPGLEPEATNTLDATVEWRPGPVASVSVTAFHDRIEDVQDLLPLRGNLEVPGNIGDGTRSGLRTEMTLPLNPVGLRGGRLDLSSRWQTSEVDDPLTANARRLSGERAWSWDLSVRQDLTNLGLAWGASIDGQDGVTDFGLDELDDTRSRTDVDAFVELRAIQGVLVRLRAENLLRGGTDRDRQVFGTSRAVGDLAFREQRLRRPAREFTLEVSGTF